MNAVRNMTVKELALAELAKEQAAVAKDKLKELYKKQSQAKKVLANIEREIEEYMAELDTDQADATR